MRTQGLGDGSHEKFFVHHKLELMLELDRGGGTTMPIMIGSVMRGIFGEEAHAAGCPFFHETRKKNCTATILEEEKNLIFYNRNHLKANLPRG
jgi:hypothetical protein